MITSFKLIVFRRDDIDIEQIIEKRFYEFKTQFILLVPLNVSSTMYRENLNRSDLVLTEVEQYIRQHQLYGRGE